MDRNFRSRNALGRAIGEKLQAKQDVIEKEENQSKAKSAMSHFGEQKQKSPGAAATATGAERKPEVAKLPKQDTLVLVTGAIFYWYLGSGSDELLRTFSRAAG